MSGAVTAADLADLGPLSWALVSLYIQENVIAKISGIIALDVNRIGIVLAIWVEMLMLIFLPILQ